MCDGSFDIGDSSNACSSDGGIAPEKLLARALHDDLGIEVNPQALRMFIRTRWDRVQILAHKIHVAEYG